MFTDRFIFITWCIYSRRCIIVTCLKQSDPISPAASDLPCCQPHSKETWALCFPQVCPCSSSSVSRERGLPACSCTEPQCFLPCIALWMGILTASRLLHFRQTSAAALAGHGIILTYCQGNQKDKQKGVIIVKTEIQYLFLKSQYWLLFCSLLFTIFQKGTLKWIRTFSQFLTPFFFLLFLFPMGSFPIISYYLTLIVNILQMQFPFRFLLSFLLTSPSVS